MGRPLERKLISTLKPRIPQGLEETLVFEFEKFKAEKELDGLSVTQTDFLNWIIVNYLKERKNQSERNNSQNAS